MNIPKKIKIGGIIYDVIVKKKLDERDGSVMCGQIDSVDNVIYLRKRNNMEQTLLHEIVHGIFTMQGYSGQEDEKMVEEISQGLYAVIVDNPELFKEDKNESKDNREGNPSSVR